MSVGQISGPLLTKNLLRNGVDLSFETDLLYLKVNPSDLGVGIGTQYFSRQLQIDGYSKTTSLIVDNVADINDIEIQTNTISRKSGIGDINLNASLQIIADNIATDNIYINDKRISITTSNTDLEIRPTQFLQVRSNMFVDGKMHVTSNITFDGTITLGNAVTDTVTFNSDTASDLIPITDNTKKLGTNGARWLNVRTDKIYPDSAYATNLTNTSDNINYSLRPGHSYYVAKNGSDAYTGDHENSPFATVKHALSVATSGDTIYVFPGEYQETFPLIIPVGVAVKGMEIRNSIIKPTDLTNSYDCFLMNGESTVEDLTIKDFYYNSTANTGHAFRFANDLTVSTRSPYIRNITVSTKPGTGNVTTTTPISVIHGTGPISQSSHSTFGFAIRQSDYADIGGYITINAPLTAVIQSGYIDPPGYYTVTGIEQDSTNPDYWFINTAEEFNPAQPGLSLTLYGIGASYIVVDALYSYWDYTYIEYNKSDLPVGFGTTVGKDWIYTSSVNYYGGSSYIVDSVVDMGTRWRINFTQTFSAPVGQALFVSPSSLVTPQQLPAGRGAYIDGGVANPASKEASMLFHSCTFITPDVDCITMLNGVRVEWLNCFTYYANRGLYALNGDFGRQYVAFGPQIGPLQMGKLGAASAGGGGLLLLTAYGAEVRSIGSASVYGNYGAVADGDNTLMYLVNHNFSYIGAGYDASNDPTTVIQDNEVVELNSGKIYYTSVSQNGDYRVGDVFYVDFATGTTNFSPNIVKIEQDGHFALPGPDGGVFLDATKIDIGDFELSGHLFKTKSKNFNVHSATGEINLLNPVSVQKNLGISGDFRVDGTLTLGNETSDTITFNSEISQDLKPKTSVNYDLGTSAKQWRRLYSTGLYTSDLTVSSTAISSSSSGQDLTIQGNGAGTTIIESLNVDSNKITPIATSNISFAPSGSLIINNTNALKIPVGSNTDRPTLAVGDIRFNTSSGLFQGNNANFGGVISSDTLTSLKAHPTANYFIFTVAGTIVSTLDANSLTVHKFKTSDISIDNNIISTSGTTNLVLSNGVNPLDITVQGIKFSGTSIVNLTNSPLIIETLGGSSYVKISGTNAVAIPAGDDSTRQALAETGQFRYNTQQPQLEIYDGLNWVPAIGSAPYATAQEIEDFNLLYNLVLG